MSTEHVTEGSRGLLGRFLSYLRGDRYLVGAYPPEWQDQAATVAPTSPVAGETGAAPKPS